MIVGPNLGYLQWFEAVHCLAAGASARFVSRAARDCMPHVLIVASRTFDLHGLFVTSIDMAGEQQILAGEIPAEFFAASNRKRLSSELGAFTLKAGQLAAIDLRNGTQHAIWNPLVAMTVRSPVVIDSVRTGDQQQLLSPVAIPLSFIREELLQ